MKRSRFVALCLVLSLMLSYLIPVAYASNTPTFELGDIYVSGENAFCVYRNNDYTYCGHVNTSSVSGNFSIIYTTVQTPSTSIPSSQTPPVGQLNQLNFGMLFYRSVFPITTNGICVASLTVLLFQLLLPAAHSPTP